MLIWNFQFKCCGDVILDKLLNEINCNKFFTVIADEAADCANQEKMILVLRFVDDH